MRKLIALFLTLTAVWLCWPVPGSANEKASLFAAEELLVKFKMGKEEAGNQEIARLGAKIKERLGTIDVSRLKLPKQLSVEKAVATLSKLDIVAFAEPNYIQKPAWAPSDPSFGDQWGLTRINVLRGWGIHTGRRSTIIAIIDTGVDLDHPDLSGKIVPGYDYVDNDDVPDDIGGHGTHCAGIAAAIANNKKGIAGVCPNCSIMPIRALGPDGGFASDTAKGIVFATDHGANVISLSLGTYQLSSTIRDAINYADSRGVLIVAAAGNDNVSTAHYPAYFNQCIAVGASDQSDKQASFSNFGAWVDVAAPGVQILSTVPGGYAYKQGTSMAAPFVTGLAGLMFSCPGATATRIKQAIYNSARPIGSWVAHGRIDAGKALETLGCQKPAEAPPKTPEQSGDTTPEKTATPTAPAKTETVPPSASTTPAPPSETGPAMTVHLSHGQGLKQPEGALAASDDTRVTVSSKGSGLANYLDIYIETTLDEKASALSITLEAMSGNPGRFEVYLFDWQQSSMISVGEVAVKGTDATLSVTVGDAAKYISNDNKVRVRLFRKEKLWNGFDLGIDSLSVKGAAPPAPSTATKAPKTETPAPEKTEEGSVTNKAKSAWEKLKKKW